MAKDAGASSINSVSVEPRAASNADELAGVQAAGGPLAPPSARKASRSSASAGRSPSILFSYHLPTERGTCRPGGWWPRRTFAGSCGRVDPSGRQQHRAPARGNVFCHTRHSCCASVRRASVFILLYTHGILLDPKRRRSTRVSIRKEIELRRN